MIIRNPATLSFYHPAPVTVGQYDVGEGGSEMDTYYSSVSQIPSQTSTPIYQTISSGGQQIVKAAAGGSNVTTAAIGTAGEITSGVLAATSTATWAIPLVGAAVAGVTFWLSSIFRRNAQKTAATRVVEQIEPKLIENIRGYFSGPRTKASQAQALANFDAAWEALKQACMNSQLGDAGQRCIADRDRGSCHYRAKCTRYDHGICIEYGSVDPSGDCWNWFVGYRDPIANDPVPNMKPDPVLTSDGRVIDPNTGMPLEDGTPSLYLIGGIGLIVAAMMMGGSDG